jgi:uncharacterized protein (DUF58 family)
MIDARHRRFLEEGAIAAARYALAAPRRSLGGTDGRTLGVRAGSSLDFKDHREYEPGDDPRGIDWNAYARSDRLIVKRFREETLPHLDIVIDGSRSMNLPETEKARATLGLAGLLAEAASNAGFHRTAWMARDGCRPVARSGEWPNAWDDISFDGAAGTLDALLRQPPKWRREGVRVIISDLLWTGDPLAALRALAPGAAATVVIHLLARADAVPPERGAVRLSDVETGAVRDIFLDAAAARRYRAALARFQETWRHACRQCAAHFIPLVAEDVVDGWRLDALVRADVLRVRQS